MIVHFRHIVQWAGLLFFLLAWGVVFSQELGPEAEMMRLEQQAEELIAQGDPEGATLTMGKAALMASELAKRERKPSGERLYEDMAQLFRAQEQSYRALALFERGGGTLPASPGVCLELREAGVLFAETVVDLERHSKAVDENTKAIPTRERLSRAREWVVTVQELQEDYRCLTQ